MAISDDSLGIFAYPGGGIRVKQTVNEEPRPDEAVIRVEYGGICGSDLHYWIGGAVGNSVLREPMLLGHEVVGTIARVADDGSGPGKNVHVAVHPASQDAGEGPRYPRDRPNLSPRATYLGSAAHFPHTQGAFARYVNIPTRMLRSLPIGLDLRDAALAEPAAVAWHAVTRAGLVKGKRALVIGCGAIGALVIAVLKRAGADEIVAVDKYLNRRNIALAVGASSILDVDDLTALNDVDADVVFESSGVPDGLKSAILGAARGGRIVMIGLQPSGDQPVPISLAIARELELLGSFRFNNEFDEVLVSLADRSLFVDPIITHEFELAQAKEAFEVARDASRSGKVLIRF